MMPMYYFGNTPWKIENIYKFKYVKLQFTVFSLFGGGIAMWQWLLLWLLLLGKCLLQTHAFPGVVLPVQQLLFIDEFGTLGINQLFPEVLVLQQLQHVQTVGVPVEKRETEKHHRSPTPFNLVSTVVESTGISWLSRVCLWWCVLMKKHVYQQHTWGTWHIQAPSSTTGTWGS